MLEDITTIQYNLVYQNLILLLGYKKIHKIYNTKDKNQIISKIEQELILEFGEENAKKLLDLILCMAILL